MLKDDSIAVVVDLLKLQGKLTRTLEAAARGEDVSDRLSDIEEFSHAIWLRNLHKDESRCQRLQFVAKRGLSPICGKPLPCSDHDR